MATTITLSTRITITDGDQDTDQTVPTFAIDKTISSLTAYEVKRRVVNNATITLWSSSAVGEPLTAFSFFAIWCDTGEVEVELTCNDGDAAEAIFTVKVTADCPLILGSDDSRYNTGALTGSADVIDLIRVKNSVAADYVVTAILGN